MNIQTDWTKNYRQSKNGGRMELDAGNSGVGIRSLNWIDFATEKDNGK